MTSYWRDIKSYFELENKLKEIFNCLEKRNTAMVLSVPKRKTIRTVVYYKKEVG